MAPEKALGSGLIDAVVESKEELVSAAKQWVLDNKDDEAARTQPWDTKGYKIPAVIFGTHRWRRWSPWAHP